MEDLMIRAMLRDGRVRCQFSSGIEAAAEAASKEEVGSLVIVTYVLPTQEVEIEIQEFLDDSGRSVFARWFDGLKCGGSGPGERRLDSAGPGKLLECRRRWRWRLRAQDGLRAWVAGLLRQGRRAARDPAGRECEEEAGSRDCRGMDRI